MHLHSLSIPTDLSNIPHHPHLCFLACGVSGKAIEEIGGGRRHTWRFDGPPLPCGPYPLGGEASIFLLVGVQSSRATWRSSRHELWALQSMGRCLLPSRESTLCIQWLGYNWNCVSSLHTNIELNWLRMKTIIFFHRLEVLCLPPCTSHGQCGGRARCKMEIKNLTGMLVFGEGLQDLVLHIP